jgi:cyclic-di-GMP phosphodiesterase TipF (flagellum assembly factor)
MHQNAELAPHLVFEFSQSIVASRDSEIESYLDRLGAMGFRFSMDQVANLRIDIVGLAQRGFRYVKIGHDRLLAEQANPTMEISIQDIKRTMARHGIQLIAEKIETEAKLLEVLDLDVDYGQGFLFGEPQLDIQPAAA